MNEERLQEVLLEPLCHGKKDVLIVREGEQGNLPSDATFTDVVSQLRKWIQADSLDERAPFTGRAEFTVEGRPLVLRVQYDGKTEGSCTLEVTSRRTE